MHNGTCSNYFDLNKAIALRTGVQRKKMIFLQIFAQIFEQFVHFACIKYFSAG